MEQEPLWAPAWTNRHITGFQDTAC